ncbi:MarR family winged helix-turn-helix transcriptional regulator [Aestuariispira insulae]|uniref:DNA-binding MarR family transcriptional regulator n=1 Tax=Aestuariispira insulae TaxID=1461337 RepID=A0A3D9HF85_9PROT|nr:MarR family transcriptional regulator [Aestuariispira insulae]RED48143.1 DNA-binding MarR family transcriptional regulator [Aestuariispira insulae]
MLETLHQLITRANALENTPKAFGTDTLLHRAEIHTIQAIGLRPGQNLQQLADRMAVTKGAASQMVTKLVRKGLVKKDKGEDNRKEVLLNLTEQGWTGFHRHEAFHAYLHQVLLDHYGEALEQKMAELRGCLQELLSVTDLYEEKVKDF